MRASRLEPVLGKNYLSPFFETAGDLSEHQNNRSIALMDRRSMFQGKKGGQVQEGTSAR
jgi:hypothetical protein